MIPSLNVTVVKIQLEHVNAIDSMVIGCDQKVYLGLSCNPPLYLLATYQPYSHRIEDCGVRFNSNKIHNSLVRTKDGKMYGGTWSWIKVHDQECRYSDFEGGHLFCYDPANKSITDLGMPFLHEQIFALTIDPHERILYGITFPMKRFFSFDIAAGELEDIVELKGPLGDTTSHQITCDNEGNVWGSQANGYLFQYDPKKRKFMETSIRLPEGEFHIDSIVRDDSTNLLYGGTVQNGILFILNPTKKILKSIGKAGTQGRLPAIAIDRDGVVFGATGSTIASYFMYDPTDDGLCDFGPIKDEVNDVTAYRIHSMAINHEETLFFGESDRYPYLYVCKRKK